MATFANRPLQQIPQTLYDVVVVGAGVVGSATALQLVKRGKNVLLIEQFPIPHSRGSSQGQSRCIRKAYYERHFADMIPEAFEFWHDLEKIIGETLITQTGMLNIGPANCDRLHMYRKSLQDSKAPHEWLSYRQLRMRYPQFQLPPNFVGLLDSSGGVLKAERALQALQAVFKSKGGVLLDGTKMESIVPGDTVSVKTTKGTFRGRSVILTGGPWMKKITTDLGLKLPMKTIRTHVCYWKAKHPEMFSASASFPNFFFPEVKLPTGQTYKYFGMRANEYPNCIKVCLHTGPEIDPDVRDLTTDTWDLDAVRHFVQQFIPDLEPTPAIQEKCMYTVTPDLGFFVDRHPRWNNIIIGAGFSGHGFKLAPVIGKILGQLALNEQSSYNITPLKIGRFDIGTPSKL